MFAAYVAYTDHEIGRVTQAVDDMGKLDNTLVIYISGDNGPSAEGTTIGGKGGTGVLRVDGKDVANHSLAHTTRCRRSARGLFRW